MDKNAGNYTCNDYREEMMLLGLKQRLSLGNLSEEEKRAVKADIKRLESLMGMESD
jgi:hypothetical protein